MNEGLYFGAMTLYLGGLVLLVLGWLIGVNGQLGLISNYRAHPERYPDGPALGRWMGWTLAGGGLSFVACASALFLGFADERAVAPWTLATATWLVVGALSGLAKHRHPPGSGPAQGGRGRPGRPAARR